MTTSGSTNFATDRDSIIAGALRLCGAVALGETPTSDQVTEASEALNMMAKAWQADGMPLWAITETTWTVTSGTNSYTIGVGQTINVAAPLKVYQAFYTTTSASAIPMNVYNRYDFKLLPNSTDVTGLPINLYYQPLTDTGTIKLWPYPNDSTTQITIQYARPYQDMDAASDNFDFPAYWILALTYMLSWVLSDEYGKGMLDKDDLGKKANYWKDYALSLGTEEGSMFLQPNYDKM